MVQHQKFQTFNDTENLVKNYNFQVGEIIAGEIVFPEIMPLVSRGIPDKFLGNNPGVSFKGKVHEVNDIGEVVSFILLTEINPPSDNPNAVRPPTIISFHDIKSYSIFLVE
ncbi:hypothetical protein [Cylindrospermum sp. FACHB-282]|uniref:hypothetical protein n=1 Tax=Cylindrospermum sp. FACHB-282 TaxID=2692794 RepID=UPI001686E539|nr:hypothetical protein [Cylindrospermum sp. FACHB-282]MBD2388093.1 hypothetical protein [Cylindrospermum sp. FACHB-282]